MTTNNLIEDTRPDSDLTKEEIIERNIRVVDAHFHNENPDDVDKAIALYTDDIVWEGPNRGAVYRNGADVKDAYLDIFKSLKILSFTSLRRFATEQFVFDDQLAELEVIGNHMKNMDHPVGSRLNARLVHCFEMRDGKIAREIAYEMFRPLGSSFDNDDIPEGSSKTVF